MADDLMFSAEELRVDQSLGYPRAYAKLCRDRGVGPYSQGPPFTFTPYAPQPHQASRAMELEELFPVIDAKAKTTAKPKIFVSLLWKQLNHLGNAGFDPETFRVDPYGNVLYFHADSASPLAWDIDHWFPCSRGGLTVSTNLRLLQWQACKKKHNKLEFLVPWWDLQVGISINQFLSIFASSNTDFRHRGFSLLFSNGESEELNTSQTVDSHSFPQHFNESKRKMGLAPAAVVVSRRESNDALLTLQSIDINRRYRSNSPIAAARKSRTSMSKENENPDMVTNPYQAIVMARDSLRQREETAKKHAEIEKLDEEVSALKQKNEEEKTAIQDLELVLIKKRRRAEKCRRLAEVQSSYRAMLEKMIRDAMHQSVIYKEQLRLNQAASNALMARLEAQKAICDTSERELHKKFKQRDEIEKQIRPEWEQARKRSRMDDVLCKGKDDKTILYLPGSKLNEQSTGNEKEETVQQEEDKNTVLYLPGINSEHPVHKQLRVFLEEEQKASEAGLEDGEERGKEQKNELEEGTAIGIKDLQNLRIEEEGIAYKLRFLVDDELVGGEDNDEECRKQRGKGNVEKWLQMLLESTDENSQIADTDSKTDEVIRKMNLKYPHKQILKFPESEEAEQVEQKNEFSEIVKEKDEGNGKNREKKDKEICTDGGNPHPRSFVQTDSLGAKIQSQEGNSPDGGNGKNRETTEVEETTKVLLKNSPLVSRISNASELDCSKGVGSSSRRSFERKEKRGKSGKDKEIARSESARILRRVPSSPSIILGMKKGVDCIRKKPLVIGDDDDADENAADNSFIKSSIKNNNIKKAVKI